MGIAYFFSYIYRKYNSDNDLIIDEHTLSSLDVGYLFLDYNSMIHPCSQELLATLDESDVYSVKELDEMIITHCLDYTRYVMDIINAKNVYIMVDGVAPRAKINQQRGRRYKSRLLRKNPDGEGDKLGDVKWDSNKITPGTSFMVRLQLRLKEYIEKLKCEGYNKNIYMDFEYGEGEHKMMNVIRGLNLVDNKKKICIYGLDADLIMLSLMNVYSDRIVLVRNNGRRDVVDNSKSLFTYVNVGALWDGIIREIRGKFEECQGEMISDRNLIYDYIFLCILLGNDFLEHIPSLMIKENGLNTLIKIYVKAINKSKGGLVILDELDRGNLKLAIDVSILRKIFYSIGKSEEYFFSNIYSVYKGNGSVYRDVDTDEFGSVYFYKQDYIRYNEINYKKRYYIFYGISDIEDSCKRYLEGLYWVLGYYNGHMHNNWLWYYPYYNSPFASDISEYLEDMSKVREYISGSENLELSNRITNMEQLFMVLPKESLMEILGDIDICKLEKFKRLMNMGEVVDKYYPTNVSVDIINKEYLWQSKIFLENFDMGILSVFT